jgi:hypothetical protein
MKKIPFGTINVHPCVEKLAYTSIISKQSILSDNCLIEALKERPFGEHAIIEAITKHYDVRVFIYRMRRQIEFKDLSRKEIFRKMARLYKRRHIMPSPQELSRMDKANKALFKSIEQMLGRQILALYGVFDGVRKTGNRCDRDLKTSEIFRALADIINYCYGTNLSYERIRSMHKNNDT